MDTSDGDGDMLAGDRAYSCKPHAAAHVNSYGLFGGDGDASINNKDGVSFERPTLLLPCEDSSGTGLFERSISPVVSVISSTEAPLSENGCGLFGADIIGDNIVSPPSVMSPPTVIDSSDQYSCGLFSSIDTVPPETMAENVIEAPITSLDVSIGNLSGLFGYVSPTPFSSPAPVTREILGSEDVLDPHALSSQKALSFCDETANEADVFASIDVKSIDEPEKVADLLCEPAGGFHGSTLTNAPNSCDRNLEEIPAYSADRNSNELINCQEDSIEASLSSSDFDANKPDFFNSEDSCGILDMKEGPSVSGVFEGLISNETSGDIEQVDGEFDSVNNDFVVADSSGNTLPTESDVCLEVPFKTSSVGSIGVFSGNVDDRIDDLTSSVYNRQISPNAEVKGDGCFFSNTDSNVLNESGIACDVPFDETAECGLGLCDGAKSSHNIITSEPSGKNEYIASYFKQNSPFFEAESRSYINDNIEGESVEELHSVNIPEGIFNEHSSSAVSFSISSKSNIEFNALKQSTGIFDFTEACTSDGTTKPIDTMEGESVEELHNIDISNGGIFNDRSSSAVSFSISSTSNVECNAWKQSTGIFDFTEACTSDGDDITKPIGADPLVDVTEATCTSGDATKPDFIRSSIEVESPSGIYSDYNDGTIEGKSLEDLHNIDKSGGIFDKHSDSAVSFFDSSMSPLSNIECDTVKQSTDILDSTEASCTHYNATKSIDVEPLVDVKMSSIVTAKHKDEMKEPMSVVTEFIEERSPGPDHFKQHIVAPVIRTPSENEKSPFIDVSNLFIGGEVDGLFAPASPVPSDHSEVIIESKATLSSDISTSLFTGADVEGIFAVGDVVDIDDFSSAKDAVPSDKINANRTLAPVVASSDGNHTPTSDTLSSLGGLEMVATALHESAVDVGHDEFASENIDVISSEPNNNPNSLCFGHFSTDISDDYNASSELLNGTVNGSAFNNAICDDSSTTSVLSIENESSEISQVYSNHINVGTVSPNVSVPQPQDTVCIDDEQLFQKTLPSQLQNVITTPTAPHGDNGLFGDMGNNVPNNQWNDGEGALFEDSGCDFFDNLAHTQSHTDLSSAPLNGIPSSASLVEDSSMCYNSDSFENCSGYMGNEYWDNDKSGRQWSQSNNNEVRSNQLWNNTENLPDNQSNPALFHGNYQQGDISDINKQWNGTVADQFQGDNQQRDTTSDDQLQSDQRWGNATTDQFQDDQRWNNTNNDQLHSENHWDQTNQQWGDLKVCQLRSDQRWDSTSTDQFQGNQQRDNTDSDLFRSDQQCDTTTDQFYGNHQWDNTNSGLFQSDQQDSTTVSDQLQGNQQWAVTDQLQGSQQWDNTAISDQLQGNQQWDNTTVTDQLQGNQQWDTTVVTNQLQGSQQWDDSTNSDRLQCNQLWDNTAITDQLQGSQQCNNILTDQLQGSQHWDNITTDQMKSDKQQLQDQHKWNDNSQYGDNIRQYQDFSSYSSQTPLLSPKSTTHEKPTMGLPVISNVAVDNDGFSETTLMAAVNNAPFSNNFDVDKVPATDMDGFSSVELAAPNVVGLGSSLYPETLPKRGPGLYQSQSQTKLGLSQHGRGPCRSICVGFGGRVIIGPPRNSGIVSLYNLSSLLADTPYLKSLSSCSDGPLVKAGKTSVAKWCAEQAEMASSTLDGSMLLWSLLESLVQHDGTWEGARDVLARETATNLSFSDVTPVSNSQEPKPAVVRTREIVILEDFLLRGDRKGACDHAVSVGLWEHALLLASHIDLSVYNDVVKSFALATLSPQSPLSILYNIYAGSDVSGINIENWHRSLTIILANRTAGDVASICTLARHLWQEGALRGNPALRSGAHVCWLIAGMPPVCLTEAGSSETHCDMVLIGSDHIKYRHSFASSEALLRTEVYEFARSLGNSQYTLPTFQSYKLLHAYRLAEVGLCSNALRYCDAIANAVKGAQGPSARFYNRYFLTLLETLTSRIKISDPKSGSSAGAAADAVSLWWGKTMSSLVKVVDTGLNKIINGPDDELKSNSMDLFSSSVNNNGVNDSFNDSSRSYNLNGFGVPAVPAPLPRRHEISSTPSSVPLATNGPSVTLNNYDKPQDSSQDSDGVIGSTFNFFTPGGAATLPAITPPSVTVSNSNNGGNRGPPSPVAEEDDEDMSMLYNNKKERNIGTEDKSGGQMIKSPSMKSDNGKRDDDSVSRSSSSGMLTTLVKGIGNWLPKRQSQAHLPLDDKGGFYFDPQTKKWVIKGEENKPAANTTAPPPTSVPNNCSESEISQPIPSNFDSIDKNNVAPPPGPPSGGPHGACGNDGPPSNTMRLPTSKKRGLRSRYVDVS